MNMIVASAMEITAIFFSIFFKPAVIHHLALYPSCCLAVSPATTPPSLPAATLTVSPTSPVFYQNFQVQKQ